MVGYKARGRRVRLALEEGLCVQDVLGVISTPVMAVSYGSGIKECRRQDAGRYKEAVPGRSLACWSVMACWNMMLLGGARLLGLQCNRHSSSPFVSGFVGSEPMDVVLDRLRAG